MQIQLKDQRLTGLSLLTVTLLKIVKECVDQTDIHVCKDNIGKGEPEK